MTAAWEHEKPLTRHALESLSQVDGLDDIRPCGTLPIVSFNVEGYTTWIWAWILDKMGVP